MVNPLLWLMLSTTPVFQDPTRPLAEASDASPTPVTAAVTQPAYSLQAVLHGGGTASAIIDGRYYRLGDKVGNYRLVNIGRRQVKLDAQGESLELRLFSSLTEQDMP
ncbi:hypothetical protein [Zobellella maritima]|uniref:hypothetical protein n=1 Tax=Zobellella maritima TaxID=2059725 RepID=UPI000E30576B|nr:hypothetical protein [Zobellella maritima]